MLKPLITIITLSLSISTLVFAEDCQTCIDNELLKTAVIDKISKDLQTIVNYNVNVSSAEEFLKLSSSYLKQIKTSKDFQDNVVLAHKKHLLEIVNNPKLTPKVRARAQLICSGLVGRLADKNQSSALGKESFDMVKKSLKIDPTYEDAKTSYITAINEFTKRSFVIRKAIAYSLNIDLNNEVKIAIMMIEKEGWQNDKVIKPIYASLTDF